MTNTNRQSQGSPWHSAHRTASWRRPQRVTQEQDTTGLLPAGTGGGQEPAWQSGWSAPCSALRAPFLLRPSSSHRRHSLTNPPVQSQQEGSAAGERHCHHGNAAGGRAWGRSRSDSHWPARGALLTVLDTSAPPLLTFRRSRGSRAGLKPSSVMSRLLSVWTLTTYLFAPRSAPVSYYYIIKGAKEVSAPRSSLCKRGAWTARPRCTLP